MFYLLKITSILVVGVTYWIVLDGLTYCDILDLRRVKGDASSYRGLTHTLKDSKRMRPIRSDTDRPNRLTVIDSVNLCLRNEQEEDLIL